MPKFLCTYNCACVDTFVGFNHISEVVCWLRGLGPNRDELNPKVFIDVGEHKYLEVIVYFAE